MDYEIEVLGLLQGLVERVEKIESQLDLLVRQRVVKAYYTTAEFATIVGRNEYTVREWCRLHRIRGQKRLCGRGNNLEWMIPHGELERYQNEGLLPLRLAED